MATTSTLGQWLHDNGVTQGEFARRIAGHQTQISRYVTGERRPSMRVRRAIEDATGGAVSVESWDPPRRRRSAPLRPSHA